MFFKHNDIIYKRLLAIKEGIWFIQYANPRSPFLLSYDAYTYSRMTRVSPPQSKFSKPFTERALATCKKRLSLIEPLIQDERAIVDKDYRNKLINKVSSTHNYSQRTIRQWFFAFLAQGEEGLYSKPRIKSTKALTTNQKNIRWALNRYYFSSWQLSLRNTYNMMLLKKYSDEENNLLSTYPSFSQFRYFYYTKAQNPVKKVIARKGISYYQKNCRPLYGHASSGKNSIGVYQMDATVADVHLVSQYNRRQIIGRPYIYLAVDTASRLIAGVYVGLEAGETAVTECLRQAAMDKVSYCKRYGIDIQVEQWPSSNLPAEIITDRGREFTGKRVEEICAHFDIVSTALPPYRPDLKGVVENCLMLIQQNYKFLLKYMGVIEEDFQERGAIDYRREATLNLHEFTQIIIQSILFYNTKHVQKSFVRTFEMAKEQVTPIACEVWRWLEAKGCNKIVCVQNTNQILLPRTLGQFTRRGLLFNKLTYKNSAYHGRCAAAGLNGNEDVTIAYDPLNTSQIYLIEMDTYIPFTLTDAKSQFENASYQEIQLFLENERNLRNSLEKEETIGRVAAIREIKKIASSALQQRGDIHSAEAVENIKKHRNIEKERV